MSDMPRLVLSLNHEGICRVMEIGRGAPGQDSEQMSKGPDHPPDRQDDFLEVTQVLMAEIKLECGPPYLPVHGILF